MTASLLLPCDYAPGLLTADEWALLRELAYNVTLKAARQHIEDEVRRRERADAARKGER